VYRANIEQNLFYIEHFAKIAFEKRLGGVATTTLYYPYFVKKGFYRV